MFVVMNKIQCKPDFVSRFEELFKTRAHAIDQMEGFEKMWLLKSESTPGEYIVLTLWQSENHFKNWVQSPAFMKGHERGFAIMASAHEKPMESTIEKFHVIAE
jgi:heme-degrading monooxygenase HmoA